MHARKYISSPSAKIFPCTSVAAIYNFNETGFLMGIIATASVLMMVTIEGNQFSLQPGNHEWLQQLKQSYATGWAI
jgi:hypothetical protein